MASLSKLFSDNEIPYLDYRLAENLFCRYFSALNDARSCTAYDARINSIGIGIKTFTLSNGDNSVEKIAEFNKLKPQLEGLRGEDLARKLGEFRNDRMHFANSTYNVYETQYHIVGRKQGLLRIFNTPYQEIDIDNISGIKDSVSSLSFNDGLNEYSFNKSKSVLQKRFYLPKDYVDVNVSILEDPLALLEEFFGNDKVESNTVKTNKVKGIDYVVLPLYSVRDKKVQPKAGLNQWNAGGRSRNEDEVYIPVPSVIHKNYPSFFPQNKDELFIIQLPDGQKLSAKMCQSGLKGLMSNPNRALGNWILRKVLKKPIGELVTMDDLHRFGIDSVYVEKLHEKESDGKVIYQISFSNNYENYNVFMDM